MDCTIFNGSTATSVCLFPVQYCLSIMFVFPVSNRILQVLHGKDLKLGRLVYPNMITKCNEIKLTVSNSFHLTDVMYLLTLKQKMQSRRTV